MEQDAGRSVLVLGAQGVLGSILAGAFSRSSWEVYRGGRRPDGDPRFRHVDLDRPETLEAALAGVELVVNPVPHAAMTPERVVLRRGGTLVNISAGPAAAARSLREESHGARGLVLVNAGRIPGATNLLAADLLRAHPEADGVRIATTLSAAGSSGPAGADFLHEHLTGRARHRTATIPFPPPFGARRCFEIAEQERGWLGEVAGGRSVSTYACLAERGLTRALLALNGVGVMKLLPPAAFQAGRKRVPAEPTAEPVAMWVGALSGERVLGARSFRCAGDYLSTAAIALGLGERLLAAGASGRTGCFDPDELFSLDDLEPGWRAAGIEVS